MSRKTNFVFPFETIYRELDSQLLLAVRHSAPGRRMIVSRSGVIHAMIPFLGGGVYLGKDISPLYPQTSIRHDVAKAHDFRVIHLDEEGAFYPGHPEGWSEQLDSRLKISLFDSQDFVCTWGDYQRDYFREQRPELADQIVTTGHPRFDLCKPAWREYWQNDIEALRDEYGDYLLVNTNFAAAIYQDDTGTVFHEKTGYYPDDLQKKNQVVQRWKRSTQMLTFFVEMIHKLSDTFPNLTVIVRHHPSEDARFYRTALRGLPNVKIIHEGPVVPWILGSTGMIHEGCTTGVEGFLAEKPVVNYRPLPQFTHAETLIPNEVGWQCETLDEVVEIVADLQAGKLDETPENLNPLSRELFSNFDREAIPLVGELLEDRGNSLGDSQGGLDLPDVDRVHIDWAQYELGIVVRGLLMEAAKKKRNQSIKFYGLSDELIGPKIRRLSEIFGRSVRWRIFGNALLIIESS